MLFPHLARSFLFLVIVACIFSTFVHAGAGIKSEEEGEEHVHAHPHSAEGNTQNWDEILKDSEIERLLQDKNVNFEQLAKRIRELGHEFPDFSGHNEEPSSFHHHSDHSHDEHHESTSDYSGDERDDL